MSLCFDVSTDWVQRTDFIELEHVIIYGMSLLRSYLKKLLVSPVNKKILLTLPLFVTACGGNSEVSTLSLQQMFNRSKIKLGLSLIPTLLLAACGDGDSISSSSPVLNLNAAYSSYVKGGSSVTGEISGYCQGTKVWTMSSTYSGITLDGKAAIIANEYQSDFMAANSNKFCTSYYSSNNGGKVYQLYYDPTTVVPITNGSEPPGTVYSNQVPLPASVTAGSSGTWFTTLTYENSVPVVSGTLTWAVTADTPTTLLFTTTNTAYTFEGKKLLYNSITTYRLNANNTLTDLRKNVQVTAIVTGGQGDQNIYEVYQQP